MSLGNANDIVCQRAITLLNFLLPFPTDDIFDIFVLSTFLLTVIYLSETPIEMLLNYD